MNKVRVCCSCCGSSVVATERDIRSLIKKGWGSYGSAIYCPECTRTWDERNPNRPMPGPENTYTVLENMMESDFDRDCPNCGAKIEVDWRYCPYCGGHVPPLDEEEYE